MMAKIKTLLKSGGGRYHAEEARGVLEAHCIVNCRGSDSHSNLEETQRLTRERIYWFTLDCTIDDAGASLTSMGDLAQTRVGPDKPAEFGRPFRI